MHLTDEQTQRLLHGELAGDGAASLRAHVAGCPECRSRLEEAGKEEAATLALLRELDHALPALSAESVLRAAGRARGARLGRVAAGILFAIGAATAAYAAPGSPLPAWIHRIAQSDGKPTARAVRLPVSTASRPEVPLEAGLAVAPGDSMSIVFAAVPLRGHITVRLTVGSDLVLHAPAGTATFGLDTHRVTVNTLADSVDVQIELPGASSHVEIWLRDRRVLLKQNARIASEASADEQKRYVIPWRSALR